MAIGYDPNKVLVLVGGVRITNFAKDTFVSVAYDSPAVAMRETLQGDGIFSLNRSRIATVTLTVEPNSNAHTVFSALYQVQDKTSGGQFVFSIVDSNVPDGLAIFNSSASRLAQMPDQAYGAEAQTTDFVVLCSQVNHLAAALPTATIL